MDFGSTECTISSSSSSSSSSSATAAAPQKWVCFNFVGLLYTFYISRVLYIGDCHGRTPKYRNYGCKQNSGKYNNVLEAGAGNRVQTHKMCPTQMELYKFL